MAIWLKTSQYRLNCNTLSSMKKSVSGSNHSVDITLDGSSHFLIPVNNESDAIELINIIESTVNSGGDVTIDASPFEKV